MAARQKAIAPTIKLFEEAVRDSRADPQALILIFLTGGM